MIDKTIRANMKTLVGVLASATGQSIANLSKTYYGNTEFFPDFFAGRASTSVKKIDAMLYGEGGIVETWPDGVPWPVLPVIVMTGPRVRRRQRRKLSPKNEIAA